MFDIYYYVKTTFIFLFNKRSAQIIAATTTTVDSNEETDSSLSDDFKSIQNSIISINRPPSIVLKRYAREIIRYIDFLCLRNSWSKVNNRTINDIEL
jgi:hypothetical protein